MNSKDFVLNGYRTIKPSWSNVEAGEFKWETPEEKSENLRVSKNLTKLPFFVENPHNTIYFSENDVFIGKESLAISDSNLDYFKRYMGDLNKHILKESTGKTIINEAVLKMLKNL